MTTEEVMPVPYLSPAAALRGVELQAQQAGAHHVQPVDVHHILGVLALVAEDTDTRTNQGDTVTHQHGPLYIR